MKQTFYQLPEKDRERLKSYEMNALRWCLAAVNSLAYGQDDLKHRLECIPEGKVRYRLSLGQIRAILNDIIGTTPYKQAKQARNLMEDMELRMVPRGYTKSDNRAVIELGDLSYLIDHAKADVCSTCILTDDECRKCQMYQLMTAYAPLDDYGSGTVCPYAQKEWWARDEKNETEAKNG